MAETVKIKIETSGGDNIAENIDKGTEAVKSLRAQLVEAKTELQNLQDAEILDEGAIRSAAQRVGELTDKMADAREMAGSFAGNRLENLQAGLAGVKEGLLNLDFGKASAMAKNFAVSAKQITFGGAISSLKDLGSTFMTLGKALLTNPLFLIATVIAILVVAIVKVLDKLGVLKKIAEAVGKAFDFLMSIIEAVVTAITDFLGITSEAERETTAAMERAAAAQEEIADRVKKANEEVVQGLDNKIRMLELEGKSTVQAEREKVRALRQTALEQYKSYKAGFELALRSSELTREEIADLKEKARVARLAYQQASSDVTYFEAKTVADKKKADEEKAKADKEAYKQAADRANQHRKEQLQKQKEYEANRLNFQRQAEDLRALLGVEGLNKDLALNDIKYKRLIEDTAKNEKLLASEKKELSELYERARLKEMNKIIDDFEKKQEEDRKAKEQKIIDDMKDADEKAWSDEMSRRNLKTSYILDEQEKATQERLDAYAQEQVDLQNALDEGLITREEYDQLNIDAEKKKNKELDDLNEEYAKKEAERQKDLNSKKIQGVSDTLTTISNIAELFAGKSRKSQERAFKVQKGAQIAQATIDTYKSATGAYSSLASIPIVGPVLGAAAAAAAVTAGLLNIKKIASTKFDAGSEGGGGEAPSPGGADLGGGGLQAAPTPGSLTINGGALGGSQGSGLQLYGSRQTPVKAYVVESDITNSQNTMQQYQQRAEIG